jgi:hypothetical protein
MGNTISTSINNYCFKTAVYLEDDDVYTKDKNCCDPGYESEVDSDGYSSDLSVCSARYYN